MRVLLALVLMLVPHLGSAREYGLNPVRVAVDSWVLVGRTENFSPTNGGNIVNTGFIVTQAGVVVIDTGPSRLYGLELRRAIATVTPLPVIRVLNTHLHPDHVFGNQAFPEAPVEALPGTSAGLKAQGPGFADNMYRLVGPWMQGTELRLPDKELPRASQMVGGHRLELIALSGHTEADLVVMSECVLQPLFFPPSIIFLYIKAFRHYCIFTYSSNISFFFEFLSLRISSRSMV